jgi:hypothetical protein
MSGTTPSLRADPPPEQSLSALLTNTYILRPMLLALRLEEPISEQALISESV